MRFNLTRIIINAHINNSKDLRINRRYRREQTRKDPFSCMVTGFSGRGSWFQCKHCTHLFEKKNQEILAPGWRQSGNPRCPFSFTRSFSEGGQMNGQKIKGRVYPFVALCSVFLLLLPSFGQAQAGLPPPFPGGMISTAILSTQPGTGSTKCLSAGAWRAAI